MPVNLGKITTLLSGTAVEAITHRETHVHEGTHFSISDFDASIGETSGDEKIWCLTTPNSAIRAHFEFTVDVDNEALIELRENPTIISAGTALTVYNRDRNSSNSGTVLAYYDAGIAYNTGVKLIQVKTGTTGFKDSSGGSLGGGKWELKVNEDYVIIVFPVNAATGASLDAGWSEQG